MAWGKDSSRTNRPKAALGTSRGRAFARKIATALTLAGSVALGFFVSDVAYGQASYIYWTEQSTTDAAKRASIDTGTIENLITTGLNNPRGIAVDQTNSKIYVSDFSDFQIVQANLDGSSATNIITGSGTVGAPRGIVADPSGGKIYWADGGNNRISSANLDGSSPAVVYTEPGTRNPAGLAIDIDAGKLYLASRGSGPAIDRVNTDGTGHQDLFTTGLGSFITGAAVDTVGGKVYWAARNSGTIEVGNMDGTGSVTTFKSGLNTPIGVAVDSTAGKIYWAERDAGTISRSNLDGTGTEVMLSGLNSPRYVALFFENEFLWDDDAGTALWTTDTNWVGDVAPTIGADVGFKTNYGTGAETVNMDLSQVMQSLNFDNPYAYTLNNNVLTLADYGGNVGIFVDDTNGTPGSPITHTVNPIIKILNDATIDNMTTGSNTNLAINGDISMAGNDLTINTNGGGIEIGGSSVISGTSTADILKTGTGTLVMSSSADNTYGGETKIQGGILEIQNAKALGDTVGVTTVESGATLEINIASLSTVGELSYRIAGTGSTGQGAITLTSGQSTFLSGTVELTANATISSESGFLLLNGNTNLHTRTLTINPTSGSMRFGSNNVISGKGGITKTGAGIANFGQTGVSANTYTGVTEVQAGTLSTATSVDNLILIPGDIKLTGGTLALLHDNNVADTSDFEMAGGELRVQAGGSGSTTVSDVFNTLTLTEDSTITLNHVGVSGTGTITLEFADSSGTTWTSGKTLTISNWTGTVGGTGGGDDQIFFGNSTSGLTTSQLSQIKFFSPNGDGQTYDAKILSTGEIIPFVPVPEPSTIITGSLALLFIGYRERKRLLKLWRWVQEKRNHSA